MKGLTPLHLAVKTVNELGTARPVRSLLISGAPRHIKDNQGRTPVDLTEEIINDRLRNELREML